MTAKRQWTMFTALGCLVILVVGYMLLVRPQHGKAAGIRTQTAGVQSQITGLRSQLAQLQEESRNLAGQQAQLARIAQQLPTDPQEPTLLRKIDAAATATGVDLVNVAPGNPVPFTVKPSAAAAPSAAPTVGSTAAPTRVTSVGPVAGLADIPVVLTVSGGYFQMERFLDSLEGLQRSMLVTGFSLAYGKQPPSAGSAPTVGTGEITATINTQVFMSTTAIGAATAGTAGTTGTTSTAS